MCKENEGINDSGRALCGARSIQSIYFQYVWCTINTQRFMLTAL